MYRTLLLLTCPLWLSGCFTKTFEIDAANLALQVKRKPVPVILSGMTKADVNVVMEYTGLNWDVKTGKKSVYFRSRRKVEARLTAKNVHFDTASHDDSISFRAGAGSLHLSFIRPLAVKRGSLRGALREVWLDPGRKKLICKVGIRFWNVLSFSKWKSTGLQAPDRLEGKVSADFPYFTDSLDYALRGPLWAIECTDSLFWHGDSNIQSATDSTLVMASGLRYKKRVCVPWPIYPLDLRATIKYKAYLHNEGKAIGCTLKPTETRYIPKWLLELLEKWLDIKLEKTILLFRKTYNGAIVNSSIIRNPPGLSLSAQFKLEKK